MSAKCIVVSLKGQIISVIESTKLADLKIAYGEKSEYIPTKYGWLIRHPFGMEIKAEIVDRRTP